MIGGKIKLLLRSEIFGKRKDFRQFDKYFFGIIYYINLLCMCVVKSFLINLRQVIFLYQFRSVGGELSKR